LMRKDFFPLKVWKKKKKLRQTTVGGGKKEAEEKKLKGSPAPSGGRQEKSKTREVGEGKGGKKTKGVTTGKKGKGERPYGVGKCGGGGTTSHSWGGSRDKKQKRVQKRGKILQWEELTEKKVTEKKSRNSSTKVTSLGRMKSREKKMVLEKRGITEIDIPVGLPAKE